LEEERSAEKAEQFYQRALGQMQQGLHADAAESLTQSIVSYKSEKYYSLRGSCFRRLGKLPMALADYEKSLELLPSAQTWFLKGSVFLEQQEPLQAEESFKHGLLLSADDVECQLGLETARQEQRRAKQREREAKAEQAMSSPEIQQILMDPAVFSAIRAVQADSKQLAVVMRNERLAASFQKLISSSIITLETN